MKKFLKRLLFAVTVFTVTGAVVYTVLANTPSGEIRNGDGTPIARSLEELA